jgi:hypothetical protein
MITDGVAEGGFHTPDPSEAAALLLQLGNVHIETTEPLILEAKSGAGGMGKIERRIQFYLDAYERILGIETGTLPGVERSQIERIVNLIRFR